MENKNWVVGDNAKVLVNGKMWLQGEIIDIQNDIATVAVPVYYGSVVEYIGVESKLDDLKEIIKDIMYYKDKPGFMDLRLWN